MEHPCKSALYLLPQEVLVDVVASYLTKREQYRLFSSCKDWQSVLVDVRTVDLKNTTYKRFAENEDYHAKVLTLLGVVDGVDGNTMKTRKLRVDLEGLAPGMLAKVFQSLQHCCSLQVTKNEVKIQLMDPFLTCQPVLLSMSLFELSEALKARGTRSVADLLQRSTAQAIDNSEREHGVEDNHHSMQELRRLLRVVATDEDSSVAVRGSDVIPSLANIRGVRKLYLTLAGQIAEVCPQVAVLEQVTIADYGGDIDSSLFRGVARLCVQRCRGLQDVAALANCQKVELRYCNQVLDVSALCNVKEVKLCGLLVKDVSMLGRVHRLQIAACHLLRRYPTPLGERQDWSFNSLKQIDCKGYGKLRSFYLINCFDVEDISMLGDVQYLVLQIGKYRHFPTPTGHRHQEWTLDKVNISDLSGYAVLHRLSLLECDEVVDLSPLRGIRDLKVLNCPHVKDLTPLKEVRHLSLVACGNVEDISVLKQVESLHIGYDNGYQRDFRALKNLKSLSLQSCVSVGDLTGLEHLHSVTIKNCKNVTNVSGLSRVKMLTLEGCDGITDVSMLGTVEELSLRNCKNVQSIAMLHNLHGRDVPIHLMSQEAAWFFR